MSDIRLSLAQEAGLFAVPAPGTTLIFRPTQEHRLEIFPKDCAQIEQGFFPAHAHFDAAGWHVAPRVEGLFELAVVFAQRSRAHSMALVARALHATRGGPVVIDGQKTDGIEPLIKSLKKAGMIVSEAVSKAHGKLVVARGEAPKDWHHDPAMRAHGYVTSPAVFSPEKIDQGSVLLAQSLPMDLGGRVADIGAGWGYLSAMLMTRKKVTECHLIEAEFEALECARRNVQDPRAHFHWADARNFKPEVLLDHVVMNPPFHISRSADPELGQALIRATVAQLAPRGQLWMVANRHLPYERTLAQHFADISELAGNPAFKVLRATRPKSTSGRSKL